MKSLINLNDYLEHGYLVRILASHPGVPGSNPITAPKSLVMD